MSDWPEEKNLFEDIDHEIETFARRHSNLQFLKEFKDYQLRIFSVGEKRIGIDPPIKDGMIKVSVWSVGGESECVTTTKDTLVQILEEILKSIG